MNNSLTSLTAAGNQTLSQARSDKAVNQLRSQSTSGKSEKIEKAARDFESILVGQWLEQAEKSFATVPGTDPDQESDSGRDQFLSIACQSLAEGLSKTGGFGIAAMISRNLKHAVSNDNPGESADSKALP